MSATVVAESPQSIPRRKSRGCLGWIVTAILIAGGLLLILFLANEFSRGFYIRKSVKFRECRYRLKQIGLAFYEYTLKHRAYPPAYTVDSEGRRLHSWRTLILPFLDERVLYQSIDLSKPWDDPVNRSARERVVNAYHCETSASPAQTTRYLAIVDEGTCLQGAVPRLVSDIKDDPSRTLVVIEAADESAVHWMAPVDLDWPGVVRSIQSPSNSHDFGDGLTNLLCVNGEAHWLPRSTSPETLRALTTIAGREAIGDDW